MKSAGRPLTASGTSLCRKRASRSLFLSTLKNDSYWRARALAAHAIFDLVIDPTDHDATVAMLPPLDEFLSDPSEHVREQIAETISLIDNWSL